MILFTAILASTAAEYWNSESEDATSYSDSYSDMMNDLLLPSTDTTTISSASDNFNQAFNTGTQAAASIATGDFSRNTVTENVDTGMSWPSHSNSPSGLGTSAYNSDFVETSNQGYLYPDMDYLAHFEFDSTALTAATPHSSQPDNLFLPPPTHVVDSFPSDSPNSVPEDSIQVLHNPNKRLRISDFTEENILPDNERRKRSKPERLIL
jgi:hypothetical protein